MRCSTETIGALLSGSGCGVTVGCTAGTGGCVAFANETYAILHAAIMAVITITAMTEPMLINVICVLLRPTSGDGGENGGCIGG